MVWKLLEADRESVAEIVSRLDLFQRLLEVRNIIRLCRVKVKESFSFENFVLELNKIVKN